MNMAARHRTFSPDMGMPAKRELPSQIDNGNNLLGAILMHDSCFDALPPGFDDHVFDDELHAEIFREMKRLNAEGKTISPITIKTAMSNAPAMVGELSFGAFLVKMASDASGPSTIEGLSEALMIGAARRRLRSVSQVVDDIAFAHEITLADEIKAAEDELSDIRTAVSGETPSCAGDSYIALFQAACDRSGIVGVPIGLPEIGKVLSEPVFEAGNLYGLLSSSGEGKSSLTMQIIYHAVAKGHPVLFLSYDQSAGQCVRQMIAQQHGIEVRRQREPARWLKKEEQDKCLDFAMWLNKQPLEIIRCKREGVDRLIAYGRRFVKRYGNGKTPLVVIDHIGKVKPRDPKLSPDRISGDITVELKAFADEMGAAVLILNQRNGEGTKRDNPRPIARDLYGGEGARADYDAVLYLYRPEKYRNEAAKVASSDQDWKKINRVFGDEERWKGIAELGVIKSRFGDPSITDEVKFDAQFTRYVSQRQRDQEGLF